MPDEIVQIKRYPNRRFYDRSASKYISQEEIESLVVSGRKVEIRDKQTNEDITRSVLTRILLERQPDKMLLFPTDMLHFILRANEVSTGFLRDYFQHSLTYLEYLSRHSSTASSLARPMHWVKAWLDGIAPNQPGPNQPETGELPADAADGEEGGEEDEASRLAQRIQALESRIQQLETQEE